MNKSLRRSKSKHSKKKLLARPSVGFNKPPKDAMGLVGLILQRISWEDLGALFNRCKGPGRPAHELSGSQLLLAILFHYVINCAGTLGEHLVMLMGIKMSESSLSERRQATPFEVFVDLLSRILRPLNLAVPEAFYQGLRLAALDGVMYSVCNHKAVNKRLKKGTKKGQSAFAKLGCAVLVELAMHNPLAAVLGRDGQSEWNLAQGLLKYLPTPCLLLADRLYGCGAFICAASKELQKKGGHFLFRIKVGLKVEKTVEVLEDGSALVEIKALEKGSTHRIAETLIVREIHATLRRPGGKPIKVRFWTSLLDPKKFPARELVALYATRWEHELYFRELKTGMGINDLLQSQTVDNAAQEVAAMIIGSALIAEERSKLQPGEELSNRISFIKTWSLLEPLWLTLSLGGDLLSETQKQQLADRFYWMISQMKMGKKRARSCARVLRQPVQRWPKKKNQKSIDGPVEISLAVATAPITERN